VPDDGMMFLLFAGLYFVPAAIGAVGFWALWRLTRLIDLGLRMRRVLFAVLGSIAFAPMLVPVATIYVGWVPNFLLLPSFDVFYYIRFATQVATSLLVTGAVFWVIARLFVASTTLKFGWSTTALPIATLILVASIYRYRFPSRDIDRRIDPIALEAVYGERLDRVIGLLNIDDEAQRQSEITMLRSALQSDPSVLHVMLQDPALPFLPYRGIFDYRSVDSPQGESCSSAGPYRLILMRCTWEFSGFSQRQTLKYKRLVAHGGGSLQVVLDLDYEKVLEVIKRPNNAR
jgi:hypothetical protein